MDGDVAGKDQSEKSKKVEKGRERRSERGRVERHSMNFSKLVSSFHSRPLTRCSPVPPQCESDADLLK